MYTVTLFKNEETPIKIILSEDRNLGSTLHTWHPFPGCSLIVVTHSVSVYPPTYSMRILHRHKIGK